MSSGFIVQIWLNLLQVEFTPHFLTYWPNYNSATKSNNSKLYICDFGYYVFVRSFDNYRSIGGKTLSLKYFWRLNALKMSVYRSLEFIKKDTRSSQQNPIVNALLWVIKVDHREKPASATNEFYYLSCMR